MPRKKINLPYNGEYLSVPDEKGKLDKKLESDISKEVLAIELGIKQRDKNGTG
jgi:hypothetical protein